jgi:hypothetical protein
MKNLKAFFLSLLVILSIPFVAHAQKDPTAAADEAFNSYRYSVAIERYKKAYARVKGNDSEKKQDQLSIGRMLQAYQQYPPFIVTI